MSSNLIEIHHLSCSYSHKEEDKVLLIENLALEKGKIIFLLGSSGSGKSTLLETLGLMNNTIASGNVELFYDGDKKIDYSGLWKNNDWDQINRVRKDFLSFIFQETNLMENFTAYENICLSQMIKNDAGQDKAMDGAVKLMKQVKLPPSDVGFDTLSVNLSGGQRQRVSFVRALNTDFKLLLCDEPTGNLDEVNAHELLNIVKQNLDSEKTAVLVSHDVNLALKYADQIILLSRNPERGYGEVLTQNIYNRNQWSSLDDKSLSDFRKSIVELFIAPTKTKENGAKEIKQNTTISYRKLFHQKEGRVLFGKGYINLLILVSIISLTLLAIGFANGTLKYLNTKLHDTFVNCLAVSIPWAKSSSSAVEEFTEQLNADSVKSQFLIDTVTSYKETGLPLFHANTAEEEFLKGRLLQYNDPITKDLFGVKNFIAGDTNFHEKNDLGIVVTEKLLSRLGYPSDAGIIYLSNDDKDTTQTPSQIFRVPIPVRAIIKEIPGKNEFLITDHFYTSRMTTKECVFDFRGDQRKRIIFFVAGSKTVARDFKNEIEKDVKAGLFNLKETAPPFDENNEDVEYIADRSNIDNKSHELSIRVSIDTCEQMCIAGYEVSLAFNHIPFYYATTENVYKKIISQPYFKKEKFERIFDYNIASSQSNDFNNDYLCINFNKGWMDKIDDFKKYVNVALNTGKEKDKTNVIELDAGNVKEIKNFNYISKITLLISSLLIAFAILAISLFVSNLLKTHLSKVKMNLGTFKAFGLSDKESKNIYVVIMMRFILISLAASFALAYVLGKLIEKILQSYINLEDSTEYFRLFDVLTGGVVAVILIVSIIVSYYNVNRILSKTPGDLIYNR